jgi:hypothetical protein
MPSKPELTIAIDYLDLVWISDELFTEEPINRLLGEYAERGVDTIQWRVSVLGQLLYHTKLGDRYTEHPFTAGDLPAFAEQHQPIYEKCKAVMARMDPMEVAVRLCRKHGIRCLPWLTIYDDAGYHPYTWSRIITDHPEFCWKAYDRDVYYHGVVSYVYPEVVAYRLAQIEELLGYGGDGIHLCLRSHSRPPGYNEAYLEFLRDHSLEEWNATPTHRGLAEMYDACERQFGFDPPAVEAYRDQTGKQARPDDPDWWAFRRQYLVDFLKQAGELTRQRGGELSFGPIAELGMFPPEFFPSRQLLDERIVDRQDYGATATYCDREEARRTFPELFANRGHKNYFYSVNSKMSVSDHVRAFESTGNAAFLDRFDGLLLFEAMHLVLKPELWEFVQHLRESHSGHAL